MDDFDRYESEVTGNLCDLVSHAHRLGQPPALVFRALRILRGEPLIPPGEVAAQVRAMMSCLATDRAVLVWDAGTK